MPTKKPRLQLILETEYYEKYKYLCERDGRTESNLGKLIIQRYIDQYEEMHGEIQVSKKSDSKNEKYPIHIPYGKK